MSTAGQVAYEGYMRVHDGTGGGASWGYAMLEPHERAAWETAAAAVLDAVHHFRFAVGQYVTWDEAPGAVWQIIERRQHEGTERTWRTYDLLPAAGALTDFCPRSASEMHLQESRR